jgi:hypothetical protein
MPCDTSEGSRLSHALEAWATPIFLHLLPDALLAYRFGATGQLLLDHPELLDRDPEPGAQMRAGRQFLLDLGQPALERRADVT